MKLPEPAAVPRVRDRETQAASVDAIARLVLSWVDGEATIAEIGGMCGMGDEMVRRVVADLASRGIVEVSGCENGASSSQSDVAKGGAVADESVLAAEVARVTRSLESTNFYDLLGVEPDADRKQLRSAYFAMSKTFHPDRAFGKDARDLSRKMEIIFRRMTQAYDVLSSAGQREEYDKYIADQLEVWRIEKQLKDALDLERGLAQPDPSANGAEGPTSSSPAITGTRRVSDRPRTAKPRARPEPSAPPKPRAKPEQDPAHEARRKRWKRERAGRALKGVLRQSGTFGTEQTKKNVELMSQASIAVESQQHSAAIRLLEEVLGSDPSNPGALKLLARAQVGAASDLAQGYIRQGMYERRQGDVLRARAHFEKALETDVKSVDARYQLADLLLETRSELPRALTLCREVIGMGGQRARYFATLGELLLLAKQQARAREAFRKAISLEPDNKEYRKRLKACGL